MRPRTRKQKGKSTVGHSWPTLARLLRVATPAAAGATLFLGAALARADEVDDYTRKLIDIEQVGGKMKIVLLFAACRILARIETHAEIEVAVADPSPERIDLDEIVGPELDISADAVQPVGV